MDRLVIGHFWDGQVQNDNNKKLRNLMGHGPGSQKKILLEILLSLSFFQNHEF